MVEREEGPDIAVRPASVLLGRREARLGTL